MPLLDRKQAAPSILLPDTNGKQVRLNSFRGKQPVVLIFWPCTETDSSGALEEFVAHIPGFEKWRTKILVITRSNEVVPDVPFQVLIDADGTVWSRYVDRGNTPAVFILDRYTAPLLQVQDGFPDIKEALEAIRLSELSCII